MQLGILEKQARLGLNILSINIVHEYLLELNILRNYYVKEFKSLRHDHTGYKISKHIPITFLLLIARKRLNSLLFTLNKTLNINKIVKATIGNA